MLTFDHVGGGLYTFDLRDKAVGFAIAGSDKKFVWADAKLLGIRQDRSQQRQDQRSGRGALRLGRQPGLQCL